MRLLTREMDGYLAGGAWIRKIFELGLELKKQYGEDAVCDFSLGNPDLPPPPAVGKRLAEIAAAYPGRLEVLQGDALALDALA